MSHFSNWKGSRAIRFVEAGLASFSTRAVKRALTVFLSLLTALWSSGVMLLPMPVKAAPLTSVAVFGGQNTSNFTAGNATQNYNFNFTTATTDSVDTIKVVFPTGTVVPATNAITNCTTASAPALGAITCSRDAADGSNRTLLVSRTSSSINSGTVLDINVGPITSTTTAGIVTATVETKKASGATSVDGPTDVNYTVLPSTSEITSFGCIDQDVAGPGVDGRDVACSWTAQAQTPTGFTGLKMFVVRPTVAINASNVLTNGCGGSACQDVGFFTQFSQSSHALSQSRTTDSSGTAWGAGAPGYKACLLVDAATDTLYCTAASFNPASDTVTDTVPPFIDHFAVHDAITGVNAVVHAIVSDEQTVAGNFSDGNFTNGRFQLFYGFNVSSAETAVEAVTVLDRLYSFIIPLTALPAVGGELQYYLTASDGASNSTAFCASPSAVTAVACKAAPLKMRVVDATPTVSVAGTITSGGANLSGARVFAGGIAAGSVLSAGNGTYTISGLPANTSVDVVASKGGYCKGARFEPVGTANLTAINLSLAAGTCNFTGGGGAFGAGGGAPVVVFSGPPDNAQFVPQNEKIRVGLSTSLNPATVNIADATQANSTIYLTTDDGTTKIAGSVTYCSNASAPGCSMLPPQDTNTILFSPTADLTANTLYSLVITESVLAQSGSPVQGNRPGGGHRISFTTSGGAISQGSITTSFGTGGQFMPPFVRSMMPAPGVTASTNAKIVLEFNETMNTSTLTTTNILLRKNGTNQTITIAVDNNTKKLATLTPSSSLTAGEYEVRVLGAVANAQGVAMRPPNQSTEAAFTSSFTVGATSDSTAPSLFAPFTTGATAIAVNQGAFEFGFSEPMAPDTLTTSNISMVRGATAQSVNVLYDASGNTLTIVPTTALAPNTAYTISFGTGVKDLANNALSAAQSFAFTTGTADTSVPKLKEVRCDDNACSVFFTEGMNSATQVDANSTNSSIRTANYTLTYGATLGTENTINLSGKPISYDGKAFSVKLTNLGMTAGQKFRLTAGSSIKDLSGNAIDTGSSANVFNGKIENSQQTFGGFGEMGMFGPPPVTGGTGGSAGSVGTFKPEGFGNFTAEQFALGAADESFPFNAMASQDVNVFHTRFNPGVAVQNGDQVVLTFPSTMTVTNATEDTQSPFKSDLNEARGAGTVTISAVSADNTAKTVTVTLGVTGGTPGTSDSYTLDLRRLTNPSVPKGPDSAGYTVGIKVKRGTETIANKTGRPFFINEAGSRSITVNVYAGSQSSPTAGANGTVRIFGGGPAGPMDRELTMTNGIISAVNGTSATNVSYTGLNDGCYFLGTEPNVTLNSVDYFGQQSPEPICVDSTNTTQTKNIVLTSATASAGTSAALTVKFSGTGLNFGGNDVDIFAGGPGKFSVKTVSSMGVPDANGYTIRLNGNGIWFVGFGPAMSKGSTGSGPSKPLPVVPTRPAELVVSGIGTASPTIAAGKNTTGATFDAATNTLTFTFATPTQTISVAGQVTDGTNGLANIEVFAHANGFGAPTRTTTNSTGNFTLSLNELGTYEIGGFKEGLPPYFDKIEVRADGTDAGTDPDIFYKGKQITQANPFVIKVKKPSYTISGKVLDDSSNGIGYAPVFASDANGAFIGGGTSSDGSYTLFVDAGTWNVKAELPPNKSDSCGTLSKTVTVTTESKSSQNITPSSGTCYTISGTVQVGAQTLNNTPLFVEEWNTTTDRPAGGFGRPSSTSSTGTYEVKVKDAVTYRIGTFHPDFGELSKLVTVSGANKTNENLTAGTTGLVTLAFTNGAADMEGFVELKKADDRHTRFGKPIRNLTGNQTFTVKEGTYNYSVHVKGVGQFSGTVATGATATVSLSSNLVTISGNINDNTGADVKSAVVTLIDATDRGASPITAVTDSSGNYSIKAKAGTYEVSTSVAGHVAPAPATVSLTANTANYDFGGASPDQSALAKAGQVITGTVFKSDGTTPVTDGSVTAVNATTGTTVTATIDPTNGNYSLPVTDGSWAIKGVAPLHGKTTKAGAVTVSGADVATQNVTLTSDATRAPVSSSSAMTASTGGTINDAHSSGIKLTAGAGVLGSTSSSVTLEVEKTFTAPDTDTLKPLADATFSITATSSGSAVKNLSGNAEIQIDYTSLVSQLPTGVAESDLKLAYYSPESDSYVPVEGGFTLDATNNTITGLTDHFTDFVIVFTPPESSSSGSASSGAKAAGQAPSPASDFKATSDGTKVTLTWKDPPETSVTSLMLVKNGQLQAATSINAGVKTYTDTAVIAGQTYTYAVRALTATGVSTDSSTISIKVESGASVTAPAATTTTAGGGGGGGAATTTTTTTTTTVRTGPLTATDIFGTSTPAASSAGVVAGLMLGRSTPDNATELKAGSHAYGAARVSSLVVEQGNAKGLADHLHEVIGKAKFNKLFWKNADPSKGNKWWYTYVNAYVYGGYPLEAIKQGVRFGGKTVHPSRPWSEWQNSADYKAYINRK